MRTVVGLGVAVLLAGGLYAQHGNFVNPQPVVTGGFGNVVFPGGTAATVPGIQRSYGNFVSPLGSGPRLVVPNANQAARAKHTAGTGAVYAYPLVVGGYGYGYGYAGTDVPTDPQGQQQGNVTVIYPPQPAPVIINQYGQDGPPRPRIYEMPAAPEADTAATTADTPHYLLAFKDHTIYSAVNYWVDGDTLHYFTAGNTHNQVSLSLIDRDLTARLNRESGVEVKLPAAKQ
jgi:hypothetical protein